MNKLPVLEMCKRITGSLAMLALSGCAVLHHVQVGDIDNRAGVAYRPFDLKVSETGVNLDEAGDIAKAVSRSKTANKDVDNALAIIGLFQMGPRTGNPVFNEGYAKNIVNDLYKECPSGRITNLMSIREMRKYPVISGEIVKITGSCAIDRKTKTKKSKTSLNHSTGKSETL